MTTNPSPRDRMTDNLRDLFVTILWGSTAAAVVSMLFTVARGDYADVPAAGAHTFLLANGVCWSLVGAALAVLLAVAGLRAAAARVRYQRTLRTARTDLRRQWDALLAQTVEPGTSVFLRSAATLDNPTVFLVRVLQDRSFTVTGPNRVTVPVTRNPDTSRWEANRYEASDPHVRALLLSGGVALHGPHLEPTVPLTDVPWDWR